MNKDKITYLDSVVRYTITSQTW